MDVSSKLADGKTFQPTEIVEEENKVRHKVKKEQLAKELPFQEHYDQVVHMYKKEFEKW
ncbi:hypothetical protein ACDX78_05400 [Virgibacillus oceani]